jgi:hypothetical protein
MKPYDAWDYCISPLNPVYAEDENKMITRRDFVTAINKVIDECADLAAYKVGCLDKAETWSLGADVIHDRIEEAIRALKEEPK